VLIVFSEFFKDEITAARIVVLIVISVLTGLFVSFSKINQGKYYSSFWVEGLPILWLVLLLLAH
jgi:hypothetical protein